MCRELQLNEAQYIRLRAANTAKLTRLEAIAWQYKDDIDEQQIRIGELEAQYEMECSRILTPSQLSLIHGPQLHDSAPAQANSLEGGLG